MTLNCIHFYIVTGSFLYWCVIRPASQRFFIHSYVYLQILIISYLATFLGTNSLSVLMCRKAVNQSINVSLLVLALWVHPTIDSRLVFRIKRNAVSNFSPVQSLTEKRFQTVVSKINAVWNRSPEKNIRAELQAQPTGMLKHSPESKRSLESLSRKEMQAQSAVKNRIAVSNSSPKQNRSVTTQKVTRKNSWCRFLHWSSNLYWTNS